MLQSRHSPTAVEGREYAFAVAAEITGSTRPKVVDQRSDLPSPELSFISTPYELAYMDCGVGRRRISCAR